MPSTSPAIRNNPKQSKSCKGCSSSPTMSTSDKEELYIDDALNGNIDIAYRTEHQVSAIPSTRPTDSTKSSRSKSCKS
eukprot:1269743-Ditylum_brightwellii.AAC.1